jgi:hypothetical protein
LPWRHCSKIVNVFFYNSNFRKRHWKCWKNDIEIGWFLKSYYNNCKEMLLCFWFKRHRFFSWIEQLKIVKCGSTVTLVQSCPTLSPFATCGDKTFECGDRQLFRTGFVMVNTLHITQIMIKVAIAKPLSPQLWRMWRQRECGWTPLR